MGSVCQKPKMLENEIFTIDVVNNIENQEQSKVQIEEIIIPKKTQVKQVFVKSYTIKLQKIERKKKEAYFHLKLCNKNYFEDKEQEIYISSGDMSIFLSHIRSISNSLRSVESSIEYIESEFDQQNFSMKVVLDINKARINNLEYSKKIDELAKNVKINKNTNRPFLEFNCNGNTSRLNLTKGISTFEESSYYIKNLKMNLQRLKIIEEDININFDEEIDRKLEIFMEKVRGKYEIIAVNIVYIDCFDNPEMSTMISIIDGNQMKDIRKNIFSKEVTHILVNNKKIEKEKRVIYYLFAKSKFENNFD